MNVATVCFLLLAVAVVQIYCKKSNAVCYHPGMTCKSNGKGGGSYWLLAAQDYLPPDVLYGTGGHGNGGGGGSSWLLTMQESRDRANAKLAAVKAFMCDCCCASVPCSQESLCGTDRNCPVNDCFARILAKAAADDTPITPNYSAEILTASLFVKKALQTQERAELQDLMADVVQMRDANA